MNDELENALADDANIVSQLETEYAKKLFVLLGDINNILADVPGLDDRGLRNAGRPDTTSLRCLRAEYLFCDLWESIKGLAYGSGERVMCERTGIRTRTVNSVTMLSFDGVDFQLEKRWSEKHLEPGHGFDQAHARRNDAESYARAVVSNLTFLSKLVEALPAIVDYFDELRNKRAERIRRASKYAVGVLDALKAIK